MATLVIRRVVRLLVVLAGVSLVTFAILHASGDPVALMMPQAPESDRAVLRLAMGFNEPPPLQFARFLQNTAQADLGQCSSHPSHPLPLLLERMPTTHPLTVLAM